MNIGELSHGGGINSYTCNVDRTSRRILVYAVEQAALEISTDSAEVIEIDCWVHLRNVWLGGMTK